MNKARFGLYIMTAKGAAVLQQLIEKYSSDIIAFIVTARDAGTCDDRHDEIVRIAKNAKIPIYSRSDYPQQYATCLFAVSWRWIIPVESNQPLVVFHDSLLPKYRGFAPLVSALINGDDKIGVTALFASKEYDKGPIIGQASIKITYPITISNAIIDILPCYEKLAIEVATKIMLGKAEGRPQDDAQATYSLWRNDNDYYVKWAWDAQRIQRFVDAVGFPYKGAAVTIDGQIYRLRECIAQPDVKIENRDDGKVIFSEEGKPVVVCGQGLLKIIRLTEDNANTNLLPLPKFRTRFGT